jgi:2-iminobutanoate/2-iminopropanoate deaminase
MNRVRAVVLTAFCVVSACAHPANSTLEVEFLAANGPSTNPYSPAVRVGNLLFLSAQVGLDAQGKLVAGGMQTEARQTLNNITAQLKFAGSSMDQVVKCTVYLTDMNQFAAMNEIYASYFKNHKPTRGTVGVASLPYGALIEIDCTAVVG